MIRHLQGIVDSQVDAGGGDNGQQGGPNPLRQGRASFLWAGSIIVPINTTVVSICRLLLALHRVVQMFYNKMHIGLLFLLLSSQGSKYPIIIYSPKSITTILKPRTQL